MPYYPLSTIEINKFTAGGEFIDPATGLEYVGYFHTIYTGQSFTGTNPNQSNCRPLKKIVVDVTVDRENINTTQLTNRIIPSAYYAQPTQQDYQTGQFQRYFTKKVNQPIFIEINNTSYQNLINQNPNWVWENYVTFDFPWQLSGTKQQVVETNQKIVALTETTFKVAGLAQALRFNFSQFYVES